MKTLDPEEIYKILIKKVHPDINPKLADAGRKAQEVNDARKDLRSLLNLGVMWGYFKPIIKEKPKPPKREEYIRTNYPLTEEGIADMYVRDYVKKKYNIDI